MNKNLKEELVGWGLTAIVLLSFLGIFLFIDSHPLIPLTCAVVFLGTLWFIFLGPEPEK